MVHNSEISMEQEGILKEKKRSRDKLLGLVILLSGMSIGLCVALFVFRMNPSFIMPPKPGSEKIIERMDEDLDLTDEQENKLRGIFKTRHQELEALMEIQIEKTVKLIKSILTKEQTGKFKEILKKHRQDKGKPPFLPGEPRPPSQGIGRVCT